MVRVDKKISIIFLIWLKKLGGVFVYLFFNLVWEKLEFRFKFFDFFVVDVFGWFVNLRLCNGRSLLFFINF